MIEEHVLKQKWKLFKERLSSQIVFRNMLKWQYKKGNQTIDSVLIIHHSHHAREYNKGRKRIRFDIISLQRVHPTTPSIIYPFMKWTTQRLSD